MRKTIKQPAKNTKRYDEPYLIRLNKFLAESGVCSRRKADDMIASGVVRVNKKIVTELGTKVKKTDFITVNGDPIKTVIHFTYVLLNKPKDTITTASDEQGRATVMDIVHSRARIFPVGRLDRNTTGVLLLTNDGELANRLIHPRYQIPRTYTVGLDKPLKPVDALMISKGIELEDGMTSPCEVFINPTDKSKVTLTLTEGRHHEVKRIFEALYYEVRKLDRKSFANLSTKGMSRGEFRHLTKREEFDLKKYLGLL